MANVDLKNNYEVATQLNKLHDTITTNVERYLREHELTRVQFAERLGVSKGYVSQLLNARKDLKLSSLITLAAAMNKEPELMFFDRNPATAAYGYDEYVGTVGEDKGSYGSPSFAADIDWEALAKLPAVNQSTAVKQQIDALRPFSRNMEEYVLQETLRIWNYNSNAIEGNKLTYGETIALLLYGITAKGKPLKDHLDIIGHQEAVEVMLDMVKGERPLRQSDIRQLHQIMLKEDYPQHAIRPDGQKVFRTIHVGRYKSEPNHVQKFDGDMHYFAEPNAVPGFMRELMDWQTEAETEGIIHPLLRAAVAHHQFVAIHPFDDGNGRIGRIFMNFIFMRAGYPPVIISVTKRKVYYDALAEADQKNYVPLVEYIGARLLEALKMQHATARGEDIGGSKWNTPNDDPR